MLAAQGSHTFELEGRNVTVEVCAQPMADVAADVLALATAADASFSNDAAKKVMERAPKLRGTIATLLQTYQLRNGIVAQTGGEGRLRATHVVAIPEPSRFQLEQLRWAVRTAIVRARAQQNVRLLAELVCIRRK